MAGIRNRSGMVPLGSFHLPKLKREDTVVIQNVSVTSNANVANIANGSEIVNCGLNPTQSVTLHTVEVVQVITTLILNAALFSVVITRKKLRKKHSSKLFLNLQLVHMLTSISHIVYFFHKSIIEIYLNNALLMEMFIGLVITTVDRFVAIKHPYTYEHMTTPHVYGIIACSWIPSVVFIAVSVILKVIQYHLTLISTSLIAIATIVLSMSNANTYVIARKHHVAISNLSCVPPNQNTRNAKKKLRSLYVSLSIVISFILLWFPYFVHNLLLLAKGYSCIDVIFTQWVDIIALFNSLLDPLLFIVFRRDTKTELRRIFGRNRSVRSVDQDNIHSPATVSGTT